MEELKKTSFKLEQIRYSKILTMAYLLEKIGVNNRTTFVHLMKNIKTRKDAVDFLQYWNDFFKDLWPGYTMDMQAYMLLLKKTHKINIVEIEPVRPNGRFY